MDPDKLQQAWQSQSCETLGANPDVWLKVVRLWRRAYFWADMIVISCFLGLGIQMLVSAFREIQRGWPWLIYSACLAWIVAYILLNRWRRRRNAARYDDSMLAHVERSIDDIEHQMRLDRNALWWYILPIALGCMIPPVLLFAMDYGKRPLFDSLLDLLRTEAFFVAVLFFVYVVMEFARRMVLKRQLQELESLRAVRESLLNTDE